MFSFTPKTLFDVINRKSSVSKSEIEKENSTEISPNNSSDLAMSKQNHNDLGRNNFQKNKIAEYEKNEIVSYQSIYDKSVKWIPAKIRKKISKSIYEIQLTNGSCKTAHLRQLRKTKTKNILDWPGNFENSRFESHPDNVESNSIENDIENNFTVPRNRNRKRKRYASPTADIELRRSERLAKVPKPSYRY